MYKFRPILKQTLWGGEKIGPLKRIGSAPDHVGESWEISAVEGNVSVVSGGEEDGMLLTDLIDKHKEQLMGKKNYATFGHRFPLLIKFIDAAEDLSVQVHPNDETAHRMGKPCGKTEMWYLMATDPKAKILAGLKKAITPEQYKAMVADNTIPDAIAHYDAHEGDCFFLPGGRIHSIGAGCLLAEIQQTSDTTFRIYDFNRRDSHGNLRPLHTNQAAQCIDYHVLPDYRTHYEAKKDEMVTLVDVPMFTTSLLDMTRDHTLDLAPLDTFVILICTSGSGTIAEDGGPAQQFTCGDTVLIAASTKQVTLTGRMKVIQTYVR